MTEKDLRVQLTAREREVVIAAVAGKASGLPLEAAKQVLAAIEVLDGKHPPILVWPEGLSREERAAWHEGEAAYWRESAVIRGEGVSPAPRSADKDQISGQSGESTVSADTPLPRSA